MGLGWVAALLLAACLAAPAGAGEEYTFDLSEIERKPARLGGYVEARPSLLVRDADAAPNLLRGASASGLDDEYRASLQLEGSYEWSQAPPDPPNIGGAWGGSVGLHARTHTTLRGAGGEWTAATRVYESTLTYKPSVALTAALGKKTLKWGKGYAWNPVAFIDRPKDPNEPDLALEGFWVATADLTRSFRGPLKTLSFTPVVAPVYGGLNESLGRPGRLNLGGKLYLLLLDTDVDLMLLGGGSRPPQYGFDLSRNLASNFEVHGEVAYRPNVERRTVTADGQAQTRRHDATSFLVGMRYLTPSETTFILEYYRNGMGYTPAEMRDYFALVDGAYSASLGSGNEAPLQPARAAAAGGYGQPHAMRDYLYLRASRKDAFGVLYFTPSLTAIANLNDRSLSLTQEMLYAPVTNTELRARFTALVGPRHTEFGEKAGNFRAELMARRHF